MSEKSKHRILNKIAAIRTKRTAGIVVDGNSATEYSNDAIYRPIEPDLISCFKAELEAISGQCIVCENEKEFIDKFNSELNSKQIPYVFCREKVISELLLSNQIKCSSSEADVENMQAGITTCEFLIARTGSLIISSATESGRQMLVFPPIHFVVARASQLLSYPEEALNAMLNKYNAKLPSVISTITGPSRTADIEKTLVLGAHGPKELVVFLLKN